MPIDHREAAFEDAIEHHLLTHGGYTRGRNVDYDRTRALDRAQLFAFLHDSQPELMDKLRRQHGPDTEPAILEGLARTLETRGTLDVLRHGARFPATLGATLRLAYFRPAHGLNPESEALYAKNRLTVVRQLRYAARHDGELDLALFVNGIPIVTAELKNPLTGQTAGHAVRQYRDDRSATDAIFRFRTRALVHFAVDTEQALMTTRLDGEATRFLPFDRGDGTAAGNPENPGGYRTAYLWEEIWERHGLLDVLARFLHLQVERRETGGRAARGETLIFPRYHQLEAVHALVADARAKGAGESYLVQHSAGSGKSNSIAWLAHRLASLHDDADRRVFDSVIVVTDRRVLDQQLQDTIYQFEHRQGVVECIRESGRARHLAEALEGGAPIIVTTLQTFPFVTDHVARLPERRYAVIVDEAHSSQSGEGAIEMRAVLSASSLEEAARADAGSGEETEEQVLRAMLARGRQPNLSFFAFTATPKHRTLEVFGRRDAAGKPRPFHLYSMRQAIEEGFILDVLAHYTTYRTYYRLLKEAEGDPEVRKKEAARALARYAGLHAHAVDRKTEVMVEHFRQHTRHRIGGRAKAMVVTASRLHAVRYKQAFDRYTQARGCPEVRALVAFSGTVREDTGVEHTEASLNGGIRDRGIPEAFSTPEYPILIVAEKFQTGFDQPLLHTMYVDRRLSGIQAVQTLSRLNRTHPGKEDTFVLDFVNEAEEIAASFQPYYERTTVAGEADPQLLYDLQHRLSEARVYDAAEVERFARVFFRPRARQRPADHAQLDACVRPAVDRFRALPEEEREEFRSALASFRNLYAFLSQVIPYTDSELEKLYAFGRFLLVRLPRRDGGGVRLDDEVTLQYFRIEKVAEGALALRGEADGQVPGPVAVGTGAAKEEVAPLSAIIDVLNQRFGTRFRPADQYFVDQIGEEAFADPQLVEAAHANEIENFRFVWDRTLQGIFIDRMDLNEEFFARFMNDPEFHRVLSALLMRDVYDRIRAAEPGAALTLRRAPG